MGYCDKLQWGIPGFALERPPARFYRPPTLLATCTTRKSNELELKYTLSVYVQPGHCLISCPSWLARLELKVVLETILRRFPNTTMPDQEIVWSSNVIRGPEELVLQLEA